MCERPTLLEMEMIRLAPCLEQLLMMRLRKYVAMKKKLMRTASVEPLPFLLGSMGGGIGRALSGPSSQELLRASGRPLRNPDTDAGLPSGVAVAPPRGSERFRAPPGWKKTSLHMQLEPKHLAQAEDSPLHSAESVSEREAAAAALAAAMEDARSKMPPPPEKQQGSPSKRHRQLHPKASKPPGLKPAPMFGANVSLQGQAAPAVGQGPGAGYSAPATAAAPVHHHSGSSLARWPDMRADQKEILTSVQEQRAEFRHMGQRLETVEGRQDDLRQRLDSMEKELREVRRRSASPLPTPRHAGQVGNRPGTGQAPRAPSSTGAAVVDDWQLVIGGYRDAKREDTQQEVRDLFEAASALPLLRNIITPYVRSNVCRIELLYLDENLQARRRVQQSVIAGLRRQLEHRHKQSQIVGQEQASLWVSRNRSAEERNRLRALLGLKFGTLASCTFRRRRSILIGKDVCGSRVDKCSTTFPTRSPVMMPTY